MPGWSYSHGLGSRIRQLFSLRPDSTNFMHFARLFQSQLLTMCRGDDDQSHLKQDAEGMAHCYVIYIYISLGCDLCIANTCI